MSYDTGKNPMTSLESIDLNKEWCYESNPTDVIGVPFVPAPVQVTYDGGVYTGNAELCFFYGKSMTPVNARQRTFLNGWMPVLNYDWRDGDIKYELQIFAGEVPPLDNKNVISFAKIKMTNMGTEIQNCQIAAAIRASGINYRKGESSYKVTPLSQFKITDNSFFKDGKLFYSFSSGASKYAVLGEIYKTEYRGKDYKIVNKTETGIVKYPKALEPGNSFSVKFKMPRVPIEAAAEITAIENADYDKNLQSLIKLWDQLLGHETFTIPEKRVQDSWRASLVHLILSTREQDGKRRQGSGLPYDPLFLNDYFDMQIAYDVYALPSLFIDVNTDWLIEKQVESGLFMDFHNRGKNDLLASHGQALNSLAHHFIMTHDLEHAAKAYPTVQKAVQFIINDHKTNEYGILRPSVPYDAPMVTGHHTCHNLFGILGLRSAIRMARMLGKTADVKAWTKVESSYRKAVLKAIDAAFSKEGYITSGLYDWEAGHIQGKAEFGINEFPNQDWENNLLVYPSELLETDDPRVAETLAAIRWRKYREGIMSYRNGMHLHQYITLNQANNYMAISDHRHALLDFYHVLLHNTSTHAGFENLLEPWTNRNPYPECPPPHAWAAAKNALFIRNMMVREYGGNAGLDESKRDLYLFSLISPAWNKLGNKVVIDKAPTEWGKISASLNFTEDGAHVDIEPDFKTGFSPQYITFTVPYFINLESLKFDNGKAFERNGVIYMPPVGGKLTLNWNERPDVHKGNFEAILNGYRREFPEAVKDTSYYKQENRPKAFLLDDEKNIPAEPLSFNLIKRAFMKEYSRRYNDSNKKKEKTWDVSAPSLMTKKQRETEYNKIF